MKTETESLPEILAAALKTVTDASRGPMTAAAEGMALAEDSVRQSFQRVTADQARIQEKMRDGSRLTKHRFTSRLPVR